MLQDQLGNIAEILVVNENLSLTKDLEIEKEDDRYHSANYSNYSIKTSL